MATPQGRSSYVADRASVIEQPACPQLQEISIVFPASLQYWLQYLLPGSQSQLQAG
jgi:hypothetical protein